MPIVQGKRGKPGLAGFGIYQALYYVLFTCTDRQHTYVVL